MASIRWRSSANLQYRRFIPPLSSAPRGADARYIHAMVGGRWAQRIYTGHHCLRSWWPRGGVYKHHHVTQGRARKGLRSSGDCSNVGWLRKGVEDTQWEHTHRRGSSLHTAQHTCRRRVEMRRKLDDGEGRVSNLSRLLLRTWLRRGTRPHREGDPRIPSWRPPLRPRGRGRREGGKEGGCLRHIIG